MFRVQKCDRGAQNEGSDLKFQGKRKLEKCSLKKKMILLIYFSKNLLCLKDRKSRAYMCRLGTCAVSGECDTAQHCVCAIRVCIKCSGREGGSDQKHSREGK